MRRACELGRPAVLVLGLAPATPADHDGKPGEAAHWPDGLKWKDGPPSLPPGAKIAVLEGDPAKAGPFVFRVKERTATASRRTPTRRPSG